MSVYQSDSGHLREVLLFYLNIKNLWLMLIENSQTLTVTLLLEKERIMSGFNASRMVIFMSKTDIILAKAMRMIQK